MMDFTKGIIVGIIAVKVFESELVQNYIKKKTKALAEEAGHNFVDAVFDTRRPGWRQPDRYDRKPYTSYRRKSNHMDSMMDDQEGNPVEEKATLKTEVLKDSLGNPHVVILEASI